MTTRKLLLMIAAALSISNAGAQQKKTLTLEQCYQLAEANYPLTRQRDLIRQTRDYNISNIAKGIYPQLNVNGTGTYQSAVTNIEIPPINGYKINIPAVPKDQYKIYGEVSQTLTGFGINRQRREIGNTDAAIQEAGLNTDLYALKDRVNNLFFGALLFDDQIAQNELTAQDIRTGINKVQAAVTNGTDFRSSVDKLKAQLLKTQQHTIELTASKEAYTDQLALFINQPIDSNVVLVKPAAPEETDSIRRPELQTFDLQLHSYEQQVRLTRLNLNPQLSAFFQGGYGKPNPVNFLSTQWSPYYLTGLRLSWTIGGVYTYKKDRLINANNEEIVRIQRSTFLFNTRQTMRRESSDIRKYRRLIATDDDIVRLRESVNKASAAQLENGVINSNDYLLDVNAAAEARQDRAIHQVQLLMAQYDYKTTSGN